MPHRPPRRRARRRSRTAGRWSGTTARTSADGKPLADALTDGAIGAVDDATTSPADTDLCYPIRR